MDLSAFFSGRVVRACVTAFHLRRYGTFGRAAENYFSGDPGNSAWSQQKQFEALRSFGAALVEAGVITLPAEITLDDLGQTLVDLAITWDPIVAHLRSEQGLDGRAVGLMLLREAAVDLAVRFAALGALRGLVHRTCLARDFDAPGALRVLKTWCNAKRADLVQGLDQAQLDKWLAGTHVPDFKNLNELAKQSPAEEAEALLISRLGLAQLLEDLRGWGGSSEVDSIVDVGLAFAHQLGRALTEPEVARGTLVDLVLLGIWAEDSRQLVDRLAAPDDDWRRLLAAVQEADVSPFLIREGRLRHFTRSPEQEADERKAIELARAGSEGRLDEHLRDMLARKPDDADVRLVVGSHLAELGRHWPAEEQYRLAIALEPENPWCYWSLGSLYCSLQRFEAAVASIDGAPPATREHPGLLGVKAFALLALRRPVEAVELLERAVQLQPSNVALLDLLANAEMHAGRRRKAEQHARAAFRLGFSWTYRLLNPEEGWAMTML